MADEDTQPPTGNLDYLRQYVDPYLLPLVKRAAKERPGDFSRWLERLLSRTMLWAPRCDGWDHPEDEQVIYMCRHADRYDLQFGLYEFRKASTEWGFKGCQQHDTCLSDAGKIMAREIGDFFGSFAKGKIKSVLVSPLLRTMQTADPIASQLDVCLNLEDGLAEVPVCYMEGMLSPIHGGLGLDYGPNGAKVLRPWSEYFTPELKAQRQIYFQKINISYTPLLAPNDVHLNEYIERCWDIFNLIVASGENEVMVTHGLLPFIVLAGILDLEFPAVAEICKRAGVPLEWGFCMDLASITRISRKKQRRPDGSLTFGPWRIVLDQVNFTKHLSKRGKKVRAYLVFLLPSNPHGPTCLLSNQHGDDDFDMDELLAYAEQTEADLMFKPERWRMPSKWSNKKSGVTGSLV
jgi:hypothetical protein